LSNAYFIRHIEQKCVLMQQQFAGENILFCCPFALVDEAIKMVAHNFFSTVKPDLSI